MIAGRASAKSWAGDSNNFGKSVRYIARTGALREGQEPALAVWSANVSSIETAPLEMERLAAQSRTKDPLYFFTASWSWASSPPSSAVPGRRTGYHPRDDPRRRTA